MYFYAGPPAHWRLILLIHDFSLVIGGKLHSEYLGFSLLVANYSRNITFFLYWWPIILGTFPFFFTGGQVAESMQTHTTSMQNLAGSALFLPQGGTLFQLVPLGSPQGYFMGKYSPLTSIKFLPPIQKWSKLFAPEKIEKTWNLEKNWLSTLLLLH